MTTLRVTRGLLLLATTLVGLALAAPAIAQDGRTCPGSTPTPDAVVFTERVLNDCPTSNLIVSGGLAEGVTITEEFFGDCFGFANLHTWTLSADGGLSRAEFENCSAYRFWATITLSTNSTGTAEAGLRISPWWSPDADGRFLVNGVTGDITCFGGRLPFYSFTASHGITYTMGNSIRLEVVYEPHSLTSEDPATITYKVVQGVQQYTSGPLPFDMGVPGDDPPHGLWGELYPTHIGGYVQPSLGNTGMPDDITATWTEIGFEAPAGPAVEPTVPATALVASGIGTTAATLSWTNGDGAARIVVGRLDAPVSGIPADGQGYAASATFGQGSTVAPGEYVVYAGSGSSVAVDGLAPGRTYHFSVFEYNGSGSTADYLTTSPATGSLMTLGHLWTGAGDGASWGDALNWNRGTVPGATDVVFLDNSLRAGGYAVVLPSGAVTTAILRLAMTPATGNSITLTLPITNTGVPGLRVGDNTAGTDDLILGARALLRNSTGATTGNGVEVNSTSNGTLRIDNGGRYVHNCPRSTAGTAPRLSTAVGTETGEYEYESPASGLNPIAISASGRTYGNLTLTRAAGWGYTMSGASALTVRGMLRINPGTSLTSTMTAALNLGGDLVNDGSAALSLPTSQPLVLNGISPQTISGANGVSLGGGMTLGSNSAVSVAPGTPLAVASGKTLTVPSAAHFTCSGPLSNSGTLLVDGTMTAAAQVNNGGTVQVNGTFELVDGGWGSGSGFLYGPAGTLVYNPSGGPYGVNDDSPWPSIGGPATVIVDGQGISMIVPRTVSGTLDLRAPVASASNLTIGGSLIKRAGGAISGDPPRYEGDATLVYAGTVSNVVASEWTTGTAVGPGVPNNVVVQGAVLTGVSDRRVPGDLTLTSGGVHLGSGELRVGGDISGPAPILHSGGTLLLDGGAVQSVQTASALNRLTVTNPVGAALAGDLTVNGALWLQGGPVSTGTHMLTIAPSGYVSRTTGHVNGLLRKTPAAGSGVSIAFEVGDATTYAPVSMSLAQVTTPGPLTVRTVAGDHPALSGSTFSPGSTVNRHWSVTNGGMVFTSASATFQFSGGDLDPGVDPLTLQVGKYDGGAWTYPAVGGHAATSTQALGLGSFSDFVLAAGPSGGPLAGAYDVGAGGDYATLTQAVTALGTFGVSGPVTFLLTDATYASETLPITIGPVTGASATNTVTIKPAPGMSPVVSGSSASCVIALNGADHVILDGSNTPGGTTRDLTLRNTSTDPATAAVCLFSSGGVDGATHDVVKNVNLACGADQTLATPAETFGIIASGGVVATGSDGAGNDANIYQNNHITMARWGIYLRGAAGTANTGTVVAGNVVGPASFGSDQIGRAGIVLEHQDGAVVSDNEVRFAGIAYLPPIQAAPATSVVGIGLGGSSWTPAPTPTTFTNGLVTGNRVHDLAEDRVGGSSVGILLAASGTPTANLIANNMVWNVRSSGTSTAQSTAGVLLHTGDADRVVHNSISLAGDLDPDPAITGARTALAVRVATGNVRNLTLADNILALDVVTSSSSVRCALIMVPDPVSGTPPLFSWGSGGSDRNDYHVAPASPGWVGILLSGMLSYSPDFASWQTAFTPPQDAASVSGDPLFVAPGSDLHIDATRCAVSAAANAAAPVAGVTTDADGDARGGVTPDIGADEFTPAFTTDACAAALVDPLSGAERPSGAAFAVVARFVNSGSATQTSVPVRYRILDAGSVAVYDQTLLVAVWPGESVQTLTFPDATLGPGTYTLEASTLLPGDLDPSDDLVTGTLSTSPPLAGSYTVGAGGDFATLTAAAHRLNGSGVSAPVTLLLTDPLYDTSTGEVFPIEIHEYPGDGPGSAVTIRPAPGMTTAISGAPVSALIRLMAADHVTLDGSNTPGGATRDLTLSLTGSAIAAVSIEAPDGSDGAEYDGVRNCVIRGVGSTTRYGVFLGALIGSAPAARVGPGGETPTLFAPPEADAPEAGRLTDAAAVRPVGPLALVPTSAQAPNSRHLVANNDFGGLQYGVYANGYYVYDDGHWTPGDVGNQVVGNAIGVPAPGPALTVNGAYFYWQQDLRFTGNDIQNVTGTTGLQMLECAGAIVTGNRIHAMSNLGSVTGASIYSLNIPASGNLIAGNWLYDLRVTGTSGTTVNGFYLSYSPGDRYLFNTVSLTGALSVASATIACLRSLQDSLSEIRGNAFHVDGSATGVTRFYARHVQNPPVTGMHAVQDHNDLFVRAAGTATAYVGRYGSVDHATLAEWQAATGADAHSVSGDPLFVGPSDLHVTNSGPLVSALANAATPDPAVTTDWDGEARSTTAPDIGADEFTTHALALMAVHGTVTPAPDLPQYNPGTVVTITAAADIGYQFSHWTGDAGGTVNPLDVTLDADKAVTAVFDPIGSQIALGPHEGCSSGPSPCVTVPCTISRSDAATMRAFSVTLQLSSNLELCTPTGIVEGTYLSGSAPGAVTAFQVVDNGGGSFTVDGALLGLPCGAIAPTGNLFDVRVRKAALAPDGAGIVTVTEVLLRDCDNGTLASAIGRADTLELDATAPAAVAGLIAAQQKSGNDADGTTKVSVAWTATGSPGDSVLVYRAGYGAYPEYDDAGGGVPPVPIHPPAAPWTLAGSVAAPLAALLDEPPTRDFWYYVAFVKDPCGNVSPASNRTGGTLDYHLGDVSNGVTACVGDNQVTGADVSLLGAHYGITLGPPGDPWACLDVGPTTDFSADARPTTDNRTGFEDLMLFAINFSTVGGPLAVTVPAAGADDALTLEAPARVAAGESFTATLAFRGSGAVQGLSAQLAWDPAMCEPLGVGSGGLIAALNGVVFSPGPGVVDAAVLGAGRGIAGAGTLATVRFRALADGEPRVKLAAVDARDGHNRKLALAEGRPQAPAVTAFAPPTPNPFDGHATLTFALARPGAVELAVYSVDGRRVRTLASGAHDVGVYRLGWDGTDEHGRALQAGLYYARLQTPEGRFTRTLVRVR